MDPINPIASRVPHPIPTREFSFSENIWPAIVGVWHVVDSLPLAVLVLAFAILIAMHRWGTRSAALVILPSHHNTPIMMDKDRLSPSLPIRPSFYFSPSSPNEKEEQKAFEAALAGADFSAVRLPNGTWVPRRGSRGKGWRRSLGSVKEEDGSSSDEV